MKKERLDPKRAERYDLQILGRLTLEKDGGKEESCICNTINISLSGAFVETGSVLPMGSLLKYSFCVPGANIPINITGEIVRGARNVQKRPLNPGTGSAGPGAEEALISFKPGKLNCYGIMFLDLSGEDRLVLERYFAASKAP